MEANPRRDYWPTDGWHVSTPEQQGLDSDMLADMIDRIDAGDYGIDSVTVVRNGYLVFDVTFHPFPPHTGHIIHSCTKSVVASLIGVAIDRGLLAGLDQPVLEILRDAAPPTADDVKASMTIEDLLTMSTGLRCRDSYLYGWEGLTEMRASDDWTAHVLALPMSEEPGTRFEYCNGSSFLLSAIVTEVTEMSAHDFAMAELFEPLGISDVSWPFNADGINIGWGEMVLRPHDMAKFGYLYLNDGWWDGVRILPEGWVDAATAPHIDARTLADAYGYQWWVSDTSYAALGFGGQYIIVAPEIDVVAVFTSGLPGAEFTVPRDLFERFVVGAISADDALPPNPAGEARIDMLTAAAAAAPAAREVPEPPVLATELSGRRFFFDPNDAEFSWFRFDFGPDEARFRFEDRDGPIDVAVGLDGVPRVSDAWGSPWAFTGEWIDDRTFEISWVIVGRAARGSFEFSFGADQVDLWFRVVTTGSTNQAVAHLEQ
jgi:CubicO group peptidase (beta-lactamase class C family)